MSKPIIALPMGDPAGIGPEIVLKALANPLISQIATCVVIGDRKVLEQAMRFPNSPKFLMNTIATPEELYDRRGVLNLVDLDNVDLSQLGMGTASAMCGRAAYEYLSVAIHWAMSGQADAVTTAPISPLSLRMGEVKYIDQTAVLGALTGTQNPVPMLQVHGLHLFSLCEHVSLRTACDLVTTEHLQNGIYRAFLALRKLGITRGTMAVAGLNPHLGVHGLFGSEETTQIAPTIQKLQQQGFSVEGPVSPESVFYRALQGQYNSVFCLYHDQGSIAAKTFDFEHTISVTVGLPILHTSVGHGTAFSIAGQGTASPQNLIEALRAAVKYIPYYLHSETACTP